MSENLSIDELSRDDFRFWISTFAGIPNQVREQLDLGKVDINCANPISNGRTPLHLVSSHNNIQIAKLLIQYGVDINKPDYFGNTPLHFASKFGCDSIIKLLLEHGADINKVNISGRTPLAIAIIAGQNNIVKILLEHYIDLYEQELYTCTFPVLPTSNSSNITELKEVQNEVVTRSQILSLLHILFETRTVNFTDDEAIEMMVKILTLEEL